MTMENGTDAINLHATCLVLGEAGLLITGASGSGKSSLALSLLALGQAQGLFARLVADDRVLLRRHRDRILAVPPPAIAGMIEKRGLGILHMAHEPAVRIDWLIHWCSDPDRMPETQHDWLLGLPLRCLRLRVGACQAEAVFASLRFYSGQP
jgi:HPr kinase/phosphorylase